MATVLRLIGALLSLVFAVWAVISIVEANKEIRALCAGFRPGQDLEAAAAILDTGEYLRYRVDSYGGGNLLRVDSPYALGSVRCELHANDSALVSVRILERYRMEIVAAWIATVCTAALSLFQLLLAVGERTAGREWGRWAWGGQRRQLSAGMRWASGFASALLIFTILCIWEKAALMNWLKRPDLAENTLWAMAVVMALSVLGNAVSQSHVERRVMTPLALVLFVSIFAVALSG